MARTGLDEAEIAAALQHAAGEQVGGAGEMRHDQIDRPVVDLVRRR
jgi:hypothetical protein